MLSASSPKPGFDMSTPTRPDAELSGWKEIAGYLGVSVRTAQALEQEHALPVHRMPGAKGRVWTTADELAEWKRTSYASMVRQSGDGPDARAVGHDTGNPQPPNTGAAKPEQAAGHPAFRIDRRSLLRYGVVAGGALGLAGMGIGLARLRLKENAPVAGLRVEGSTVVAVARDGGELWRHTFENGLADTYPVKEFNGPPDCLIADLVGDGRDEVLFRYSAQPTRIPADWYVLTLSVKYGGSSYRVKQSRTISGASSHVRMTSGSFEWFGA